MKDWCPVSGFLVNTFSPGVARAFEFWLFLARIHRHSVSPFTPCPQPFMEYKARSSSCSGLFFSGFSRTFFLECFLDLIIILFNNTAN